MEGIPDMDRARLRANLAAIQDRIGAALAAAGRAEDACRLVAVTKSVPTPVAAALIDLGHEDLGESRPEVLRSRKEALGADFEAASWHMIGHFQRRKVRDSLALCSLVHSVHGERLLQTISDRAGELDSPAEVLLQVNVSGEAAKQGFAPAEVGPVLDAMERFPHVSVRGLMTMAPAGLDSDELRRVFSGLRELRDRCARPAQPLPELSMGMSGDFEEAILEGATLVRVGTALFDGLNG